MTARKKKNHVIDADFMRALIDKADAATAKAPAPFDQQDTPRDRLFALIMQRVDYLQADRATYEYVMHTLMQKPSLLRALGPALYKTMAAMLKRAGLPHAPWHITALALVYAATIMAWRNDTTADCDKTMKACDRALNIWQSTNIAAR